MVGMDEDTSNQNAALAMDLCAKFGLIEQDAEGNWIMASDANAKEDMIVGDEKTVMLLDKSLREMEMAPPCLLTPILILSYMSRR